MKRVLFPTLLVIGAVCACGPAAKTARTSPDEVSSPQEEQINIGYGSIDKNALGFAVDKVTVDDKVVTSYSSIAEYLVGRVPGLEINERGGIQIRGKSTLNTPLEALVVVDGIIYDNINMLNPMDIQTVEVLKDGSSSIYGNRGAGGVVLITTKAEYARQQAIQEEQKAAREARKAAKQAKKEARKGNE